MKYLINKNFKCNSKYTLQFNLQSSALQVFRMLVKTSNKRTSLNHYKRLLMHYDLQCTEK